MKSRVHLNHKTKYRVENWPEYERGLVRRGDITVWLTPGAISAWSPVKSGLQGGQRKFSDLAIETALTLRLIFGLPLRQAEGYLRSLFGLLGQDLPVPDHTTLSRRSKGLGVRLRSSAGAGLIHLIVDSTGLSIVGEGEWAAAKHGGKGRRGWTKLHLGVDGAGVIVAQSLTVGSADDAVERTKLLQSVGRKVPSFTADGPTIHLRSTRRPGCEEPRLSCRIREWPLRRRSGSRSCLNAIGRSEESTRSGGEGGKRSLAITDRGV